MKKILRIRESVKIREAKLKELEGLPLNPANVNMAIPIIPDSDSDWMADTCSEGSRIP